MKQLKDSSAAALETEISDMTENIVALFEEGKIKSPTLSDALAFCKGSLTGEYKCSVKTRYGWCCDICMEVELLSLRHNGVITVGSCCGHGKIELATIATAGENSKKIMESLGYKRLGDVSDRIVMWQAKSNFVYKEKAVIEK